MTSYFHCAHFKGRDRHKEERERLGGDMLIILVGQGFDFSPICVSLFSKWDSGVTNKWDTVVAPWALQFFLLNCVRE